MSAKHRQPARGKGRENGAQPARRRNASLQLKRIGSTNEYELVPSRCAQERADDIEEVCNMIDEGEIDVALDELRWLLVDCPDFVDAHQLLGELALTDGDVHLARGHFGYAYDLGLAALPTTDFRGTVPFRMPANRAFLTSAKGLAHCLRELGQADRAAEVAAKLVALDPSDPLGVRAWSAPPAAGCDTSAAECDGASHPH